MIFFDLITLAVIAWMIFKGKREGFISQLLSLVGIILGIVLSNPAKVMDFERALVKSVLTMVVNTKMIIKPMMQLLSSMKCLSTLLKWLMLLVQEKPIYIRVMLKFVPHISFMTKDSVM